MNILLPCGHESDKLSKECASCNQYEINPSYKQLCENINTERLARQKPTIIQRISKATEATIRYVNAGMPPFLAEDLQNVRLEQCNKCTENKDGVCVAINPETNQACGCFVNMKSAVPTEDCPLKKWPKIEIPVITNTTGKCGGCGNK